MNSPLNRTPLFLQIADLVRAEIEELAPGMKLDTDTGMARRFSVSVSVVREALSILAREGLVSRHVGRGTFVTEPSHGDKPVAILCDLDLSLLPYPQSMLQKVQEVRRQIEARGRKAVIYFGDCPPVSEPPESLTSQQFIQDAAAKKFAGVISIWGLPQKSWTRYLEAARIPLAGFGLLFENMVSHDFERFIRLSLETLKKRGRRRIAYLGAIGEWNLGGHDAQRAKDVARWFAEAGVETRPQWFCQSWHHSTQGAGWTSFREIWTSRKERPDGLVVANYATWIDVRQALSSLNLKVSEDLDVVLSRDVINLLHWPMPGVIQIAFDLQKLANEAVEMMFALMSGDSSAETRRFVDGWTLIEPSNEISELVKPDLYLGNPVHSQ